MRPAPVLFPIWCGFAATPVVFGVALAASLGSAEPTPTPLAPVFALLAMGAAVASLVLPERLAASQKTPTGEPLASTPQTTLILGLAFGEAASLLGFTHAFLAQEAGVYVPYALVSLAAIGYRMPTTR